MALAAAWLLVLQSVFVAFASGNPSGAAQLDAFGNVICTHDGTGELPSGDRQQGHLPACCVLGCSTASAAYVPPPEVPAVEIALSGKVVGFVPARSEGFRLKRIRMPSNPRAPPLPA